MVFFTGFIAGVVVSVIVFTLWVLHDLHIQ